MRKPLATAIAQRLIQDYLGTDPLAPGERLPTVRELCTRYGTTTTTICAALASLEQRGLIRTEQGRGCYVLDRRRPAESSARYIGVILGQPADQPNMVLQMYTGIEQAARRLNYRLMLSLHRESYDQERDDVNQLRAAGCMGLIIHPALRKKSQLATDYLAHEHLDYPIVLMDLCHKEQQRPMVVPDNYQSGFEVASWLIEQGHRRIAFMDWKADGDELLSRSVSDRYEGYLRAHQAAGIHAHSADHWRITFPPLSPPDCDQAEQDALQALRRIAEAPSQAPTALMALNDEWAVRMMHLARQSGIQVPDALTITGFDNSPLVTRMGYTFPTSDPQWERLGETTMQLLDRCIRGGLTDPMQYVLPAPMLLRAGGVVARQHAPA